MATRRDTHAGSWYTDSPSKLQAQLEEFLNDASISLPEGAKVRGIIGPHAGYSYCGKTAGYAYKSINKENVKRVFVFGPSHHVYLEGCALSVAKTCKTPLGDLQVDDAVVKQLRERNTSAFSSFDIEEEEDEHSLEMHFPWIAKAFGTGVKVVPVVVGQLPQKMSKLYGEIFSKYFDDPSNFFVVSTDFCHWGKRFSYTYYDQEAGPIYKSIEKLDKMGMQAIESMNPDTFAEYLKKYKNTICGRNPILLLMNAIVAASTKASIQFVHYSQSSKVTQAADSSVSYASAVIVAK